MRSVSLFGWLISLFLVVRVSYGQQYLFSRYTPKNGLVNNRVRSLYQDSKGRLYVCTYGGFSVFDGSRFTNYTTDNGLTTGLVNDVVEMGEDSLWIVPNGSGLHCLVHGVLQDIPTADHFYPTINQLVHGSDGYWYALADQGFFRWEKDRFVRIPLLDSTGKDAGYNLLSGIACDDKIFFIKTFYADDGRPVSLFAYNLTTRQTLSSPAGLPLCYFTALSPTHDLLVATSEGLRRIDPTGLQHNQVRLLPPAAPYRSLTEKGCSYLYFDRSGDLWAVAGRSIIKVDRKEHEQVLDASSGLPPGEITSILQDRENNMWFTNEQNGIIRLASQEVQFFAQPQPGFTATAISANGLSDSVWFYDQRKGSLLLLTPDGKKLFRGQGFLPSATRILFGQENYMITSKEIWQVHFLPDQQFRVSLVHRDSANIGGNPCFDRQGHLLMVAEQLTVLLDGKVLRQPLPPHADQVAVDRLGRIWTATRDDKLLVYQIDRTTATGPSLRLIHSYAGQEMPALNPRSLAIDSAGRVWVGTRDRGLYCFFFDDLQLRSYQAITVGNGLSENFVAYLLCDDRNDIWACMPTGLARIRVTDGSSSGSSSGDLSGSSHFTVDDIIPSHDLYQRIYGIVSSHGGVQWAMADEGILRIATAPDKKYDYIPPILFSKVLVADEPVTGPLNQPLSLPYDRNTLAFYLGTPTFVDEVPTRYTYLLEGSRNPKWSTPSVQSAINFVNLPPGRYTLRVRALFPTGRYPEQATFYSFEITPPWWQTWWFRLSVITGLVGLFLLWFRYYVHSRLEIERTRLEKQQAIEKERTRIATDMHDDLGAGLSRIKFLSDTIHLKRQQGYPVQEDISRIGGYANEMIDKMGEIVWALNQKNDSLSDLLSYIRSYAMEYLTQAGIYCLVEAPEEAPNHFVSGEFRRNVYLTLKEALHNIVKHARARRVIIRITVGSTLAITIHDDGTGFDPGRIRPFSNGLHNMQQRIRDIGGHLDIRLGEGTLLDLSAPLPL